MRPSTSILGRSRMSGLHVDRVHLVSLCLHMTVVDDRKLRDSQRQCTLTIKLQNNQQSAFAALTKQEPIMLVKIDGGIG